MSSQIEKIYVLWMSTGLGCDGCSIAVTGATNPSVEDLLAARLPGVPPVVLVHPVLAVKAGESLIEYYRKAEKGELDPFVLVLEGSVPDETIAARTGGWWAAFGFDRATGKPITTTEWLKRLAPKAAAIIAIGSCATWGGIPGAKNNPTGAMGLIDLLGKDFKSKLGLPIINVPGCPPQGDNFTRTVALAVLYILGLGPAPELDELGRPVFAYGKTNREGCPRAGFAEEGQFAESFGDEKCLLSLGCWGPIVKCNVNRIGWINGVGGVTNMGGPCIGCTMPGFPDAFSPFYTPQTTHHRISQLMDVTFGSFKKRLREGVIKSLSDKSPRWK